MVGLGVVFFFLSVDILVVIVEVYFQIINLVLEGSFFL